MRTLHLYIIFLLVSFAAANLTTQEVDKDDETAEAVDAAQSHHVRRVQNSGDNTHVFLFDPTDQNSCFVDQCQNNNDCCSQMYCDKIAHPTPGIGECKFIDPQCRTNGQNCNNQEYRCCLGHDCVQKICRIQANLCQLEGDICNNNNNNLRCCANSGLQCQAGRCVFTGSNCQTQNQFCDFSGRPNTECCSGFRCNQKTNRCIRTTQPTCQGQDDYCQRNTNDPDYRCCSGFECNQNRCIRTGNTCQTAQEFCDSSGRPNTRCCSGFECNQNRCIRTGNTCQTAQEFCDFTGRPNTRCCSGFECNQNRCIRTGSLCQQTLEFCDFTGNPNTECCAGLQCSGGECRNSNNPDPIECRREGEGCLSIRDCCDNHRCISGQCTWDGP